MPATANAGLPVTMPFAGAPYNVPLDGTASTPGTGTIVEWKWTIRWKPPTSTATLSADNIAMPVLQNVGAGGPEKILVGLNVRDSVQGWAWDPDPDSGGWEETAYNMPTARVHIAVTTQNLALTPLALGEHTTSTFTTPGLAPGAAGYNSSILTLLGWMSAIDQVAGSGGGGSAARIFRTIFVTPTDTADALANGSPSRPYNPSSAMAYGFDGPWAQAFAYADSVNISSDADPGWTFVTYGGEYTENINRTVRYRHTIVRLSANEFSGTTIFTIGDAVDNIGDPALYILARSPSDFLVADTLLLSNPDNIGHVQCVLQGIFCELVADATTDEFIILASDCRFGGIEGLGFQLARLERCTVSGNITADRFTQALECAFSGTAAINLVTTGTSPAGPGFIGFTGCNFGTACTFTGPANSARFDAQTLASFLRAGGIYAGGASTRDARVSAWTQAQTSIAFPTFISPLAGPATLVFDTTTPIWPLVEVRDRVKAQASFRFEMDAADNIRVGFRIAGESGAPNQVIVCELVLAGGETYTAVFAEIEIFVASVGDPGSVYYHWRIVTPSSPAVILDEGTGTFNSIDLDPAFLRVEPCIYIDTGDQFSSSSNGACLSHTVEFIRGTT